jgi:hypothetical protein
VLDDVHIRTISAGRLEKSVTASTGKSLIDVLKQLTGRLAGKQEAQISLSSPVVAATGVRGNHNRKKSALHNPAVLQTKSLSDRCSM